MKIKNKKANKQYKHRFTGMKVKTYKDKESLIKYLKENVSRGEIIGTLANMFQKNAGFVIYRGVVAHMLDIKMEDEEIRQFMSELEKIIEEEEIRRKGARANGGSNNG